MTQKVLLEDLDATLLALETDDYQNMNIFANRIMSTATILADNKFLLTGFLLKDVATEMIVLTAAENVSALATAKAHMKMFASQIKEQVLRDEFKEDAIWDLYVAHSDKVRKFHLTPTEEKSYTHDEEFTQKTGAWLLKRLQTDRDVLLERKNQFLKGLLNELGRICTVCGAGKKEVMLFSLLLALDRYYDYLVLANETSDGALDKEKVKESTFPYLDRISQAYESGEATKVDALLCELIIKWRLAFFHYMEQRRVVKVPLEKGIQLPEETKKKISEAVTKALQVKEKPK